MSGQERRHGKAEGVRDRSQELALADRHVAVVGDARDHGAHEVLLELGRGAVELVESVADAHEPRVFARDEGGGAALELAGTAREGALASCPKIRCFRNQVLVAAT